MQSRPHDRQIEQIVQTVSPQSRLSRAWPLEGGFSAAMIAIEIQEPNGRPKRIILRWYGDSQLSERKQAAEDEFRLLQFAQSVGLSTPEPYHLDISGTILKQPFLVVEYIEGQMNFKPADVNDYLRQLAAQLAKIHTVDGSRTELSFLRPNGNRCYEMARGPATRLDQSLDAEQVRGVLEQYWPLAGGNATTLLHGDFWPGNTLWQEGQLAAIIDWEDARVGDPLVDLAISRSEIAWIFGMDALDTFTRHYRSLMILDYSQLPYWDLCAALRFTRLAQDDLAGLSAYFAPYGRNDITEETIRDDVRLFISLALNKLTFLHEN